MPICEVIRIKHLPTGFIIPAQPVLAARPPSASSWVHEIKHDGYRMIVRWDGAAVRIYSRNANVWTARLHAIANAAGRVKAKSFTINGNAVVLGPDGLSQFEELSRREATDTAILYAFDLVEHDGEYNTGANATLPSERWACPRVIRYFTEGSRARP
jgi:ATP-dependent DNA ligase